MLVPPVQPGSVFSIREGVEFHSGRVALAARRVRQVVTLVPTTVRMLPVGLAEQQMPGERTLPVCRSLQCPVPGEGRLPGGQPFWLKRIFCACLLLEPPRCSSASARPFWTAGRLPTLSSHAAMLGNLAMSCC